MKRIDISLRRLFPSGSLYLCTIYNGRFFEHRYFGYTQREAKQLFRAFVRENC